MKLPGRWVIYGGILSKEAICLTILITESTKLDLKPFLNSPADFWQSTVHHFADNWVWFTVFRGTAAARTAGNHRFPTQGLRSVSHLDRHVFSGEGKWPKQGPQIKDDKPIKKKETEIKTETWELPVTVIDVRCRWLLAKQQREITAVDHKSWERKHNYSSF